MSRAPWAAQVAARVGTVQFMSAAKTSMAPVAIAISWFSQLPVRPTKTSSTGKRCTSSWPVSMLPTMRRPLAPAARALACGGFGVGGVDQGGAEHGLVAVDHDVHVGGVEDAEVDLDGVRRGRAEQGVLGELERYLRAVGGGDAEAQGLDGQRDVVAVDVGHAARGGTVVLVQHAAGHDAELAPGLDPGGRGEGRDER